MTWREIARAIWQKTWPGVAALAALAAWAVGSWAISGTLSGGFLGSGEPRTDRGVPPIVLVAGATLVAIALWSRRVNGAAIDAAPHAPERSRTTVTDPRDVFDVTTEDVSFELVGGPFDGRRVIRIQAP